ncbi:MAG: MopE-related protein [Myxococcota bacterium]
MLAQIVGTSPSELLGGGTGVGDVDGDGYDDLAAWSWPPSEPTPAVLLFRGRPGGIAASPAVRWTDGAPTFGTGITGYALSAADLDGDGYSDVIVGTPPGSVGQARVFRGGPLPLATAPARTLVSPGVDDGYGYAVRGLGDVSGDGVGDLLVGAPWDDTAAENAGVAYLYLGACDDPDGDGACSDDCAPDDPDRYPGAPERCNGLDDDCDGVLPEAEQDLDGDGELACATDCDDEDAGRGASAPERCDGLDDDCDGEVDEGDVCAAGGSGAPAAPGPEAEAEATCGCRSTGPAGALAWLGALGGTLRSRRARPAA